MNLDPGKLAAACLSVWTLALLFGTVALALGSVFGRPGLAVGLSTALAGISYLWNALVPLAELLRGLEDLSPFYHGVGYDPLEHGLRLAPLLILLGVGLLVAAYGVARFARRDLGT
jgi:ABC-2 type transport system permease protein